MGLPSRLEVPLNWEHVRADALLQKPVILSTPGHYFVVDGYDERTGAYHVGQSGLAYRNGSEWMTPAQIDTVAGAPTGALFSVHPLAGADQVLPPLQIATSVPTPVRPAPPPPPPSPPLPRPFVVAPPPADRPRSPRVGNLRTSPAGCVGGVRG